MGVTRIQHNLSALNAMSNYQGNQNTLTGNLEKLSSGYRINSAADDAAGLAISEKMRSQIAGLEKAQDNANDGISLIQTAEGALTEVNSMLTRLKTLATQSANGTYDDGVDRANLQEEADALLDEIDRISQSTNFNGINLLDGSMSSSGIKQTEAGVNVNGIALSQTKSEDGGATQFVVAISNGNESVEGEDQTFKFSFKDEQGADKSASVTFQTGSDKAGSAKNLAEAINASATLGSHFTASVNDDNDLVVTSKVKAAAATGSDITTGAASVSKVENTSDNANISIDSQAAVKSFEKYSDKLYSEDGTELRNSDAIAKALEDGQKLYTSINSDGNASVTSNDVSNATIKLEQKGKDLTSDTTFTLTKSSTLDPSNTSAALQNVNITDAGKALQNNTTFTFNEAGVTSTGTASVTSSDLTKAGKTLYSDVTFEYKNAAVDENSISDGLNTASFSATAGSVAALTHDVTFTYTEASVDVSASTANNARNIDLTDKAKALVDDTTFTFTAANATDVTLDSTTSGTDYRATATTYTNSDITMQDAGKQLFDKNESSAGGNIKFEYVGAEVDGTVEIAGQRLGSDELQATAKAQNLTEDYTFKFTNNQWNMTRTSNLKEDGSLKDGATWDSVQIKDYFTTDKKISTGSNDVTALDREKTSIADGTTFNLKAGYWKLDTTNGEDIGIAKSVDSEGNDIYSIGDGSKYFTMDSTKLKMDGDVITLSGSKWSGDNGIGELKVSEAEGYFKNSGATNNGSIVKIKAGSWESSDKSLAATNDGKLTKAEAANYLVGGTAANLGTISAHATGQSITIVAKHWQANDSSLGDNGNVGNGKEYFNATGTPADGDKVKITAAYWQANGGIEGRVGDIDEYFEGAKDAAVKTGQQVSTKVSGEWTMKNSNDPDDKGETVDISDYIKNDFSNVDFLEAGDIKIKGSTFTLDEDAEAQDGKDYVSTADKTASKSYDLSTLNDGDRIQINGKNYTYRSNEKDVQSATDFHTGSQLASMSQAISMGRNTDQEGNGLNDIKVKDQFTAGDELSLQVGDTNADYQKVGVNIQDMSAQGLGLRGLDISTQEGAGKAIDTIKTAVNTVSTQRGKLGALQNRLDHTLNNLDATTQNITAAESQIRDVDMAKEMTQYSKNNILVQAAQSMLAQANSLPQGVLSLLQ
jgi:flagellin